MAPRIFQEADFMDSAPPQAIVAPMQAQPMAAQGASRVFQESDFAQPTAQSPSLLSDPIGYVAGTSDWSVSNLIPNLTSKDWWMTRPSGEKVTAGQAIAGPGMAALDTLTAGLGDETVAGGNALLDAIVGGPGYDARLSQSREVQKSFAEASPTIDTGIRLLSAIKGLPLGTSMKATDGVLKGTAKLMGEGAAYGGAYGFGEGEGGTAARLDTAKDSALSGAAISGLLGAPVLAGTKAINTLINKAPALSEKFLNRAAGAKPSDFTKSAKQSEQVLQKTGQTSLALSLNKARAEGVFEKAGEFDDVYKNIINKQKEIGKDLQSYIKEADSLRGNVRVYPKFDNAKEYIRTQVAVDDIPEAMAQLEKYKNALKTQGDGSISYLQNQKIVLGDKVYAEGQAVKEGLDNAIRRDLMTTIEKTTSSALPQKAGDIRKLNSRWGSLDEVRPLVRRELSKEMALSTPQNFKDVIRTSGGFGVPLIAGTTASAVTGDPKYLLGGLAVAGGGHLLTTPGGASQVANILQKLPKKEIQNITKDIPKLIGATKDYEKAASPEQLTTQLLSELEAKGFSQTNSQSGTSTKKYQGDLGAQKLISPYLYNNAPVRIPQQKSQISENLVNNKAVKRDVSALITQQAQQPSQQNKPNLFDMPFEQAVNTRALTKQNVSALVKQQHPLIQAIISVESAGKHDAVSKAGARGLMQVMPANLKKLGVTDPNDPVQNIKAGEAIINEEMQRFQDPRLALAAYNAGSPRVNAAIKRAGSRDWYSVAPYLPAETRAYVPKVLSRYKQFSTQTRESAQLIGA